MSTYRNGFFEGARARDKLIGWGIIMVPLATPFVLGAVFLKPEPISREQVTGCYTAAGAPTLRIRPNAIYVGNDTQKLFTCVAEPYKAGYHLNAAPALRLHPIGVGTYAFVQDRGIGRFLGVAPERNGFAHARSRRL